MSRIIEDLCNQSALPHPTKRISVIQTHISWVLVGDFFAYKIKKPVNFGFLDFTTLERRKHFCLEELRLNRRLSPDLYLGLLPIFIKDGRYTFNGMGSEPVEYAVWMKKIPQDRLMKSLLLAGKLNTNHLKEVARVLTRFFSEADSSPEISAFGEPERFKVNTDENFAQIRPYAGRTVSVEQIELLQSWTDRYLEQNEEAFWDRISGGHVKDCHGDLHMEHICLTDKVSIFDCIEFNERFRYGDTLSDVAFLLMDLEYHGAWDLAKELWTIYKDLSGEEDPRDLLTFYKVYRAVVRGKVNSFQLDDPTISYDEKAKAAETARKYFELALAYVRKTGDSRL